MELCRSLYCQHSGVHSVRFFWKLLLKKKRRKTKVMWEAVFDTAMQGLGMPYSGREWNESPPSPEMYAGPVPLVVVESGEPHHAFPCWS